MEVNLSVPTQAAPTQAAGVDTLLKIMMARARSHQVCRFGLEVRGHAVSQHSAARGVNEDTN